MRPGQALTNRIQVRGRTAAMGATHTNDLVNIADFYQQQILPDLQAPGDEVRGSRRNAAQALRPMRDLRRIHRVATCIRGAARSTWSARTPGNSCRRVGAADPGINATLNSSPPPLILHII